MAYCNVSDQERDKKKSLIATRAAATNVLASKIMNEEMSGLEESDPGSRQELRQVHALESRVALADV